MSKPALKLERRSIEALQLNPQNARKHSMRSIEALKASLVRFGLQKPIVITKDGLVICGHGTLAAAAELEWSEIDVAITNLKGSELKAFGLADNRTGELSEWDMDQLGLTLHELREEDFEVADCGFDLDDFEDMFRPKPAAKPKLELKPAATKEVSFTARADGVDPGAGVKDVRYVSLECDMAASDQFMRELERLRPFSPKSWSDIDIVIDALISKKR